LRSKLFLLLKSPREFHALEEMEAIAGEADRAAVLLNDAALFATQEGRLEELLQVCPEVFVMKDDLQARGLDPCPGVVEIDYHQLVELIMDEYDQTVTL